MAKRPTAAPTPAEPDEQKLWRPDDVMRELVSLSPDFRTSKTLDKRLWDAWTIWFDHLFRTVTSGPQRQVMFMQLQTQGINNQQLHSACNWWCENGTRWPFVADILRYETIKDGDD